MYTQKEPSFLLKICYQIPHFLKSPCGILKMSISPQNATIKSKLSLFRTLQWSLFMFSAAALTQSVYVRLHSDCTTVSAVTPGSRGWLTSCATSSYTRYWCQLHGQSNLSSHCWDQIQVITRTGKKYFPTRQEATCHMLCKISETRWAYNPSHRF